MPKKKIGRPKASPEAKKTTRIFIGLNVFHKSFIKKAAESRGISMTNLIMDATIKTCEQIMGQNFTKFAQLEGDKARIGKGAENVS